MRETNKKTGSFIADPVLRLNLVELRGIEPLTS